MHKIGFNIKKIRKEKNITRKELSQKANITTSALANYENGYRTPNDDILLDISKALEVDFNYLLGKTKFKDFKSEELKEFNMVIDATLRSSNKDTIDISSSIIQSLGLMLYPPIYKNDINTLGFLYKYVEEIRSIYSLLECKNNFSESNNAHLAKYGVYDFLIEINKRITDITDEYYCYANKLDNTQEEFLRLKSRRNNNESLIQTLNIDDFNDDELKYLHNYINFIRFNRNNNL